MKSESNKRPEKIEINRRPDRKSEIILRDNIQKEVREEEDVFVYDEYILQPIPHRESLLDSIEKNFALWIDKAKAEENIRPEPTVPEEIKALKSETKDIEDALIELAEMIAGGM